MSPIFTKVLPIAECEPVPDESVRVKIISESVDPTLTVIVLMLEAVKFSAVRNICSLVITKLTGLTIVLKFSVPVKVFFVGDIKLPSSAEFNVSSHAQEIDQDGMCQNCADNVWAYFFDGGEYVWYHPKEVTFG